MKNWKIIKYITLVILILFLLYMIGIFVQCYSYSGSYPYSLLGTDVNNLYEAIFLNIVLRLYVLVIPLIIDIILFVISIFKARKIIK